MKYVYLIVREGWDTKDAMEKLVNLLGEGWVMTDKTATSNSVHYILSKEEDGTTK